jgi:hypothetical protein
MTITGTKLFASGEILTAANVNQYLMRGVKVFADAATRDAAYGGAGEPTLAEGETCYITGTDELQSYNGAAWVKIGPTTVPTPAIAAVASAEVATLQTTGSTTFVDLATAGPSVTLTTGTSVLIFITYGTISPGGTSGQSLASVSVSGASTIAASATRAANWFSNNNVRNNAYSYVHPLTVTAGSNTFKVQYACLNGGAGGIAGFEDRRLIVMAL